MTPENFTDDQIRELVTPEELAQICPRGIFPFQGYHTFEEARELFGLPLHLVLLLQARLELKEAREQLVSHGLTSKSVVSHHPAPPETQAPSVAGEMFYIIVNGDRLDGCIFWTGKSYIHQGERYGVFDGDVHESKMYRTKVMAVNALRKLRESIANFQSPKVDPLSDHWSLRP